MWSSVVMRITLSVCGPNAITYEHTHFADYISKSSHIDEQATIEERESAFNF